MNIDEEMNYVQKAGERLLLWGLLRIMGEHGWQQDTDPNDFLYGVFEKLEREPETQDYLAREKEAQEALEKSKLLATDLLQRLANIDKYKIMAYGPQFDLNEAQEILAHINDHIKRIYDLRLGLTK